MVSKLNERQIQELRDCFKLFDTDESGSISIKELKKVLDALGIHSNKNDLKALMNVMDKDGSGEIDFEEFVAVMADEFYRKPTRQELQSAFRYFDSDNSGFITEDELHKAISKFKGGVTKNDVKKMIKAVDKDSDGKISIDEFIALMLS